MNWEAEMDKPLFIRKGGGFVTLRQALEMKKSAATKVVETLLEEHEHIVAATIRSPEGKLYSDTNHGSAYMTAAEELGVDVDNIFASWDEGFLTNTGRFVNREDAYRIAMAAKQHQAAMGKDPSEPWLEYAEVERDPRFFPKEMWPQQESVAVDLDGTLAKDSGWKGPEHIGEPVKPMLDLVKKLLDDGEDVVIFTARVHDGEKSTKEHIAQWLKDHDLPDLEITNEKRPDMEKFYDDKAVAVEKNKGVSESVSKRAFLVTYYPKRGYRPQTLVCIIDGDFTPAQVTKLIRQGAEQLAGRRLSWSREDLNIQMDSECDPEKARVAPGVPKVILNQDGSVQVLPA